ncbi:MAG TPA: glycosyl transferase family 1 [Pseudomonas sp.]|nr:glycosyl transferase family 1 [Pseudomonas sp.]
MKILMVITGLGIGGAERQVIDLAERLSQLGSTVKIAYLTGPVLVQPIMHNIELIPLHAEKSVLGLFYAKRRLVALVNGFRPDVVHSHMVHANLLARLARIFSKRTRLVCTAHSTDEGGRLRMLAYRVTDPLADLSTNVSAQAVAQFRRKGAVPSGKMIPVSNGIDTQKFKYDVIARRQIRSQYCALESQVIVAVGRLHEAKDYPNLIRAFLVVSQNVPKACLWIVGEGHLRSSLERLISDLGVSNKVMLFGSRHDISSILSAADVFVLSSAWEGFGLSVAEAMAAERVIVATDCGGVAEVLGNAGFIVPPQDSARLAGSLTKALQLTEQEAYAYGVRARERVTELFSLDSVVDKWVRIYRNPKEFLPK